jgi:PKD domain
MRLALGALCVIVGMAIAPAGAGASAGLASEDHAFPAAAVDAREVNTAFAPNGFAAIAWAETLAGGQSTVEVSLRPPGGSWSVAQPLGSTANSIGSVYPAVDANGDAAVTWAESKAPSTFVAAVATRRAGGAFGAPQTFSEGNLPRVGIDAAGEVTVLMGVHSSGEIVRSAPAGGSLILATPHMLSTCTGDLDADLAVAPSGEAIAGFACEGDASFALRRGGTWGATSTPFQGTFEQCPGFGGSSFESVKVAIDAEGHPAGLVVQTNRSDECPAMGGDNDSVSHELLLALPAGGVMAAGPLVAKSGVEVGLFGFGVPNDVIGETLGIGGGSIVASWLQGESSGFRYRPMTRTYPGNGTGTPSAAQALGNASEYAFESQVSVSASGQSLLTWEAAPLGGKPLSYAAFRPAGGDFGEPLPVSDGTSEATYTSNAIDTNGDAVIGWLQADGASHAAHARGFDATAPKLEAVSIPTSARRFEASAFTASATDVWGPVSFAWNFGDGSATGDGPAHAFAAAGPHTVTVTATDSVGNATSQSALVNVLEAPSGEPERVVRHPVSAPVISGLTQSAVRWREGRQLARLTRAKPRPPVGTTFSFNLSAPATALLQFEQTLGGRTVAGECVVQTSHNRTKRACRRTVIAGTLKLVAHAGLNKVAFQGQLSRTRKLKPGRYRLLLSAGGAGLRAAYSSLSFTILKG